MDSQPLLQEGQGQEGDAEPQSPRLGKESPPEDGGGLKEETKRQVVAWERGELPCGAEERFQLGQHLGPQHAPHHPHARILAAATPSPGFAGFLCRNICLYLFKLQAPTTSPSMLTTRNTFNIFLLHAGCCSWPCPSVPLRSSASGPTSSQQLRQGTWARRCVPGQWPGFHWWASRISHFTMQPLLGAHMLRLPCTKTGTQRLHPSQDCVPHHRPQPVSRFGLGLASCIAAAAAAAAACSMWLMPALWSPSLSSKLSSHACPIT